MVRELTCVTCPIGCKLTVTVNGDSVAVEGNACPRGEAYGKQEVLSPVRMVTSTVSVVGGDRPLISVKTDRPVSKQKIGEVLDEIKALKLSAPVALGQILVEDIAGSGAALVATSSA